MNAPITKKVLSSIMDDCIVRYGIDKVPGIVNKIKRFGFEYATKSGVSWSLDDVIVPKEKQGIIDDVGAKVVRIEDDYKNGLLTEDEKRRMVIELWHGAKNDVEQLVAKDLDPAGSVYDMVTSGARGTMGNLTQMAGMKGLIQNTAGETIEVPIISSMAEGLNPVEYFMSSHGARKGLTDTALGTARAGYLTRRLFDVAQDSIVTERDCGTKRGITIKRVSASGIAIDFAEAIRGRVLAAEVAAGGQTYKKKHYLTADEARAIAADESVENVSVLSPMSCETRTGICAICYGMDLTTQLPIDLGEAVGTIAAQAIGEPGTQLTMRTFHAGGTASVGGDITMGPPARSRSSSRSALRRTPALVAKFDGMVVEVKEQGRDRVVVLAPEKGQGKKGRLELRVSRLLPAPAPRLHRAGRREGPVPHGRLRRPRRALRARRPHGRAGVHHRRDFEDLRAPGRERLPQAPRGDCAPDVQPREDHRDGAKATSPSATSSSSGSSLSSRRSSKRKARSRRRPSTSSSASSSRPSAAALSSRPHPSSRPRRSSSTPPSRAPSTGSAASRRTSSSAASSRPAPASASRRSTGKSGSCRPSAARARSRLPPCRRGSGSRSSSAGRRR